MKRPVTMVVFILMAALFAIFLTPKIVHINRLKVRSANLEQELVKLKKQNKILEMELKLLRDDPVYLEKVAREKFSKAKEGEIVYRVVRQDEPV